MTICIDRDLSVRSVRDSLRELLAVLDRLKQQRAAMQVSSAIELLNDELGEKTSDTDVDELIHRIFSD
ncbi:MAG: hypothetical protein Q7T60_10125 [Sphingopyxis sp.]|nr:hypothetical protein [Sphingopyxis sp.]